MEQTPLYKVIVSDSTRQMLAGHTRFMAQTSPSAARKVKNALMDAIRFLNQLPERFPFLQRNISRPINITKCLLKNGISYCIRSKTKQYM